MRRGEEGLTLVEVLASLLVFSVMTLGLVPLLITSMAGAAKARSQNVGKNIALQAMERVRALPYFVSYGTEPSRVDVLDLYYPDLGSGYTSGTYTTVCTPTTVSAACGLDVPTGYILTYRAQFVSGGSSNAAGEELYLTTTPEAGYAWNSDGNDTPITRLLRMSVLVSWSVGDDPESIRLTSLVGERSLTDLRVDGRATIDHAIQVQASFSTASGPSDLLATAGTGRAVIQTRQLSQADVDMQASQARLTRPVSGSTSAQILASGLGASAAYHAPPGVTNQTVTAGETTIIHPDLGTDVAFLSASSLTGLTTSITNELPQATATFTSTSAAGGLEFYVGNQADFSGSSSLKLDSTKKLIRAVSPGNSNPLRGTVSAVTGPLSGTRTVHTVASTSFADFRLFPVTFISGSEAKRSIARIDNFTASAECKANPLGGASATASYRADFVYYDASTATFKSVELKGTNTSDPLASLMLPANNPRVYKDITSAGSSDFLDVFLFPVTHTVLGVSHTHKSYFDSASSLYGTTSNASVSADGRTATASINGAIRLVTSPTNSSISQTGFTISAGKVSCEAVDNR
jgi:type II secretory pathway pseudopilin PulG